MPLRPSIDDTNTTLITYEGEWVMLRGSSRQWESTVHMTGEEGASATFKFRGYKVWVWGTIPAGVGTNTIEVAIDGEAGVTISRSSNGSAVFNEQYFESDLLRDTYHTVILTNRGSRTAGANEFLLDRFEFETEDNIPQFTTTGSQTSLAPTATVTIVETSGSSQTPVGAIVGAVIGVCFLIILVLGILLWRKRNRKSDQSVVETPFTAPPSRGTAVTPTPFPPPSSQESSAPLSPSQYTDRTGTFSGALPSTPNPMSEKPGYQRFATVASPTTIPNITMGLVSSSTLEYSSSSQPSASASASRPPVEPDQGASSLHVAGEIPATSANAYEHPPPSYWQNTTASEPVR